MWVRVRVCTLRNYTVWCVVCRISFAHFRIWQYKSVEDNMFPPVSFFSWFHSEHFWGILQFAHEILYSLARARTHACTLKLRLTFWAITLLWTLCLYASVCDTRSMSSQHHQMDMQSVTSLQFSDVTKEKYAKLIAFHSTWLLFFFFSHMSWTAITKRFVWTKEPMQKKQHTIRYEQKKVEQRRRSSVYWETETVC